MIGQTISMAATPGLLLVLLLSVNAPTGGQCNITLVEGIQDHFDIFLNGIKHDPANPMLFLGEGSTEFVESTGNFQINEFLNTRMPLQYTIMYSTEPPLDIELYIDYYNYVRFELFEDEDQALVMQVIDIGGDFDRLWIRLVADPEEKVFGAGEQFSYFNLRGHSFPIWTREQGVGRNKSTLTTFHADKEGGAGGDYHTTYFPQPTFISTRGYYLYHEGPDYTVLDFSQPNFHELYVYAERSVGTGRVRIQNGSDVSELVGHLSNYLGLQPRLPEWVYSGAVLGVQGGTDKLRGYMEQAEDYNVAVSAVWIQDWVGSITTSFGQRLFWNWQWNQDRYPVADEHGYFVKNATNQTFLSDFGEFFCGTLDLTNPDAVNWYKNEVIKKNMIDFGLGGWMADFGEYLPTSGVLFHNGQSGEELHNLWPVLWARLNREAVEEAGRLGDIVFWTRSGFSGASNYTTMVWLGEQNVDWSLSDGVASTVTSALSLAMSGVTFTHFDIGGFTTFASYQPPLVRSEELLLRSAEMAVFTPMFRTHEGNQPSANVQYYSSRGTLLQFSRLSRMFAAMKNYTHHVVHMSSLTGLAAQRPLFLNYPDDLPSYDVKYQYMYGRDLLVAPVYLPNVKFWSVYLPSDAEASWVFLWDESMTVIGGVSVIVPAPVGQPPVFYRNTSSYISVFREVASEPLVDVPPYIPKKDPECVIDRGPVPDVEVSGRSSSLSVPYVTCVVFVSFVVKMFI